MLKSIEGMLNDMMKDASLFEEFHAMNEEKKKPIVEKSTKPNSFSF